jgi:RimJ/RimL family protein N-acetyltransferase
LPNGAASCCPIAGFGAGRAGARFEGGVVIARVEAVRKGACLVELDEFIAFHGPALERNAARHNLILGLLERARGIEEHGCQLWSLGEPGACAIRTPRAGRGILLGEVDEPQARQLAAAVADEDYPSVQGPDETARWFVAEAETQGKRFGEGEPLRIHALSRPPSRPQVPGSFRRVVPKDAALLLEWTIAFIRDADLRDPVPGIKDIEATIVRGRHLFWLMDGKPVAMAAMGRQLRDCASIAPVYTLPTYRGRGFGGAITAAVVDEIFATGRSTACLYVDVTNPASNRCYAKLGFTPVCDVWMFWRLET